MSSRWRFGLTSSFEALDASDLFFRMGLPGGTCSSPRRLSCGEIPTPNEQTSGVQRSPPPRDRPAGKKATYGLAYILGLKDLADSTLSSDWSVVLYALLMKPLPNNASLVCGRREIALMAQDMKVCLRHGAFVSLPADSVSYCS